MKIRIEEWMQGREFRDRILRQHGTRAKLERAARRGDARAQSDLADLRLFDEDPRRLDIGWKLAEVFRLNARQVGRLTVERLKLLEAVKKHKRRLNLTGLCALLGRDKKNVSDDLRILASMGLLQIERHGRDAIPKAPAGEIHLVIEQAA